MDKLIQKLKEIEKDCLQLKKEKQLTEHGQSQLDLIKIIKKTYLKKKNIQLKF